MIHNVFSRSERESIPRLPEKSENPKAFANQGLSGFSFCGIGVYAITNRSRKAAMTMAVQSEATDCRTIPLDAMLEPLHPSERMLTRQRSDEAIHLPKGRVQIWPAKGTAQSSGARAGFHASSKWMITPVLPSCSCSVWMGTSDTAHSASSASAAARPAA